MTKAPKVPPDPEFDPEFDEMLREDAAKASKILPELPDDPLANYKNKPRWTNGGAVQALVSKLLDDDLEAERQFYTEVAPNLPDVKVVPGSALAKLLADSRTRLAEAAARHAEREAAGWCSPLVEQRSMEAALRGNTTQLASLVERGRRLSPKAGQLVAEFVRGERNPRTGNPRGEPGRPKKSAEERRASNPVHDAAREFVTIREILRRLYPKQSADQIKDRAEKIAQVRANITTSVTNYRKRSQKTGHHFQHVPTGIEDRCRLCDLPT